jgi:hypothetical protein
MTAASACGGTGYSGGLGRWCIELVHLNPSEAWKMAESLGFSDAARSKVLIKTE